MVLEADREHQELLLDAEAAAVGAEAAAVEAAGGQLIEIFPFAEEEAPRSGVGQLALPIPLLDPIPSGIPKHVDAVVMWPLTRKGLVRSFTT